MTCRARVMPPLPRAIRDAPLTAVRADGSVLVCVSEAETVGCPHCGRAAALVIVRDRSWGCVACEEVA